MAEPRLARDGNRRKTDVERNRGELEVENMPGAFILGIR
jgi:hypothetical protein